MAHLFGGITHGFFPDIRGPEVGGPGGIFSDRFPDWFRSAGITGDVIDAIFDMVGGHSWADIAAALGIDQQTLIDAFNALTGRDSGSEVFEDEGCIWPSQKDPVTGKCMVFLGQQPGADGVPVNGRFGIGMVPNQRNIVRDVCRKGMVLGKDNICYERRNIANRDRLWPKGTKPLGTAEEMRAVRIAARFAGRFERTTKRMQKIGLAKKPAPRRRLPLRPRANIQGGSLTVVDTE